MMEKFIPQNTCRFTKTHSFRVQGLAPGKYLVRVEYASPEGMRRRIGANHYVDVLNGKETGIKIPVPCERRGL